MNSDYKPPFTMTEEITNAVINIGELVGSISSWHSLSTNPKLRRENRIKTIHSSLAIEQNTLTLEQVSDVISGKRVLAPPQDIKEVKNAYEIYERLDMLNPYSVDDLLKAHGVMMAELVQEAGRFRSGNAGVYAGEELIHAGTPARYVPELVAQLFCWLESSQLHPLVKSCIFHYEFEFIHPFSDGNGRTGRLWHTLLLAKWKGFFAWLPIETLIQERQEEYYFALNASNNSGESTEFVTFMLQLIWKALLDLQKAEQKGTEKEQKKNKKGTEVEKRVATVFELIQQDTAITQAELMEILHLSRKQIQLALEILVRQEKIERQGSNRNGYWKIKDR